MSLDLDLDLYHPVRINNFNTSGEEGQLEYKEEPIEAILEQVQTEREDAEDERRKDATQESEQEDHFTKVKDEVTDGGGENFEEDDELA